MATLTIDKWKGEGKNEAATVSVRALRQRSVHGTIVKKGDVIMLPPRKAHEWEMKGWGVKATQAEPAPKPKKKATAKKKKASARTGL